MSDEQNEREPFLKPGVIAIWVGFLITGVIVGVLFYYPNEWGLARRIFGGLISGAFGALIITGNRLIGRSEVI